MKRILIITLVFIGCKDEPHKVTVTQGLEINSGKHRDTVIVHDTVYIHDATYQKAKKRFIDTAVSRGWWRERIIFADDSSVISINQSGGITAKEVINNY